MSTLDFLIAQERAHMAKARQEPTLRWLVREMQALWPEEQWTEEEALEAAITADDFGMIRISWDADLEDWTVELMPEGRAAVDLNLSIMEA